MRTQTLVWTAAILFIACHHVDSIDPHDAGADLGTDGDTDTDVDGDADSDGDSDSDSEGDTGGDSDTDTGPDTDPMAITDVVEFQTTMGEFKLALYGNGAPITVTNFISYVTDGYYTDLVFHRVIPDFVVQGGGYDEDLNLKPTNPPIPLEIFDALSHTPGVISMASSTVPDSATSQFFISVADNSFLDGDYAAFGEVIEGYSAVEAISNVATHTVGMYNDVPVTPVTMVSVSLN